MVSSFKLTANVLRLGVVGAFQHKCSYEAHTSNLAQIFIRRMSAPITPNRCYALAFCRLSCQPLAPMSNLVLSVVIKKSPKEYSVIFIVGFLLVWFLLLMLSFYNDRCSWFGLSVFWSCLLMNFTIVPSRGMFS